MNEGVLKQRRRRCTPCVSLWAGYQTAISFAFYLAVNRMPAPGADAADASEFNSAGDSASESTGFDAREHEPLHVLQACS
jgi:hypothetical protein